MLDETEIQKLLRLKRHEQPPAGYYGKFLQDFHRRQRTEMLRQPLWRIAMERMGAFFSDHSMGRMAYGMASAVVLLFAGVASYQMVANSGGNSSVPAIVENTNSPLAQPAADHTASASYLTLQPGNSFASRMPDTNLPEPRTTQVASPHYIIDSRPVSYERPFSF